MDCSFLLMMLIDFGSSFDNLDPAVQKFSDFKQEQQELLEAMITDEIRNLPSKSILCLKSG